MRSIDAVKETLFSSFSYEGFFSRFYRGFRYILSIKESEDIINLDVIKTPTIYRSIYLIYRRYKNADIFFKNRVILNSVVFTF
jgi:hypothetical protein